MMKILLGSRTKYVLCY